MKDITETELAGFVMNRSTGKYELMFRSFIGSPLLVRNRAVEKASNINAFSGEDKYDITDVKLMKRQSITIVSPWADCNESQPDAANSAKEGSV